MNSDTERREQQTRPLLVTGFVVLLLAVLFGLLIIGILTLT